MLRAYHAALMAAQASGGGTYPNLALTGAAFSSSGTKFGTGQQMTDGTGTASGITVTDACGVGFWFACTGTTYCTVAQITGLLSFGKAFDGAEINFDGGSQAVSGTTAPSTASGVPTVNEGLYHWCYFRRTALTGNVGKWWVDGTVVLDNIPVSGQSNTLGFTISPAASTDFIGFDAVQVWNGTDDTRANTPTAYPVRDANTVVIWQLNGNGTGT